MEYEIRRAKGKDIEHVINLAVDTAPVSTSPFRDADPEGVKAYRRKDLASLYQTLNNPEFAIFIAESTEGVFLGHLIMMLNYIESSTGEPQGYVFDVSVVPEYQGMGIGKNLMFEAEEHCALAGMKYLCLNVTTSNKTAVQFYDDLGYQEERKRMIKVITEEMRQKIKASVEKEIEEIKAAEEKEKAIKQEA